MTQSIFNTLDEVKETETAEDLYNILTDIKYRIDKVDDAMRGISEYHEKFTGDKFDERSIQEFREHCENLAVDLENIKKEIY